MPKLMGASTEAMLVTTNMDTANAAYFPARLRLFLDMLHMTPASSRKVQDMLERHMSCNGGLNHARSTPQRYTRS